MKTILKTLGIKEINSGATLGTSDGWLETSGDTIVSISPVDGQPIASVIQATKKDYEVIVSEAENAFRDWRMMPAPQRGLVIKEIGDALRHYKEALGKLITLEMGKIVQEGMGEVQEAIDCSDFALGLSRQLYGLSMHSERNKHRMYEQWHPLGVVGVITAFNFPVAVWAWNFLISSVCGNATIWKPSSKTPLSAIAVQNIIAPIADKHRLKGLFNMIIGRGSDIGTAMTSDRRLPLISATGSCEMGRTVAQTVAKRLGRSLLELGGNNAIIVTEDADMGLVVRAILFGAVGTSGQRCTTTRRIIAHTSIKESLVAKLVKTYQQVHIGNPMEPSVLMGPLVDKDAVNAMLKALDQVKSEGGKILCGGGRLTIDGYKEGFYVQPAIVDAPKHLPKMKEETFAPILYVVGYDSLEEAIDIQNSVDQGLSSAIFTESLSSSEQFLSHAGSDCGIANVNIGTSGAEIGGAFGGEKDTGGGRESGSDSWRAYMRRQTCTINWGGELPLAQGIKFEID